MALSDTDIKAWSEALNLAEQNGTAMKRITKTIPDLDIPSSYDIQDRLIRLRCDRGEQIVGYKMGLTSKAKMEQMGVSDPIMGVLTDAMKVESNANYSLKNKIHPRIEPEIAFHIKSELKGNVGREKLLGACSWASLALEIIDSRYRNFDFRLPDVLADNCSSTGFVLGEAISNIASLALDNIQLQMTFDDKVMQEGSSSAILGHPLDSLEALVSMLSARGKSLPADSIVLAGAATAAVTLEAGTKVTVSGTGFSPVNLSIVS